MASLAQSNVDAQRKEADYSVSKAERAGMWQRHISVASIITSLWLLLSIFVIQNPPLTLATLGLFAATAITNRLTKIERLSDSQSSIVHSISYWLVIWLLVVTTGGLHSPMITSFWTVFTLALSSAPRSDHSLMPVLVALELGYFSLMLCEYFGNPFSQYPLPAWPYVHAICLMTVTFSAVARGTRYRHILVDAIRNEKHASDAKSRFVANVSHEIRTPLTTIIGWTDVLLGSTLPTENREKLQIIKESGRNLLGIINDILDYSKIQHGKLDLENTTFDLVQMLEANIESVSILVRPGVRFISSLSLPTTRFVKGDSVRLGQCINNFMSNACKFTKQGEVELAISEGPRTDTHVEIRFKVHDTGIGMSAETVKLLYQPFSQADSSMARRFGGTGLGLSITKRLIEDMGGNVRVESELGKGSTFYWTVRLEIAYDKPRLSIDGSTAPLRPDTLQVLLAEDNEFNQVLIKKLLTQQRCLVDIADNGEEAVKFATSKPYHVIFMDMQMPIMDGIEATTRIRQKGLTLPIIGLTANADSFSRREGLKAGMNDVLTKPIQLNALRACLESLPGQTEPEDQRRLSDSESSTPKNGASSIPGAESPGL